MNYMKIHSPTGPGLVSMSPLISSSRSTTTLTTLLPRPEGIKEPELREKRQTLEWGVVDDEHLTFDHASWFWRTMAGSTLLRDGSSRGLWLKLMQGGGTWLMWQVVTSCTCSVASSNMGNMRMHTTTSTAQLAVT